MSICRAWTAGFRVGLPLVWPVFLVLSGCSDTPYDIVPISGKVTYEDGQPIPADSVYVWFYPQVDPRSAKVQPRPGVAELNSEDGTFAYASTCEHADGVIPGRHKVVVKLADESQTGAEAIPKIYTDPATTPLEIEVTEGNQYFELSVKRPSRAARRR